MPPMPQTMPRIPMRKLQQTQKLPPLRSLHKQKKILKNKTKTCNFARITTQIKYTPEDYEKRSSVIILTLAKQELFNNKKKTMKGNTYDINAIFLINTIKKHQLKKYELKFLDYHLTIKKIPKTKNFKKTKIKKCA